MEEKEQVITFVKEFIAQIGFTAEVEVSEPDADGIVTIHLKTEDSASLLIGKHARMLSSLQRVIAAMLYNKLEKKVDVLLDINDYRVAQKERLTGIADNISKRVLEEKRPAYLSSFSPYERRIIHEHIANNYMSLTSYSEGEGMDRRLVIALKSEE